ncbi:MAG: DNA-3-methyladenine glycosylase, partial [Candidatus Pacearchaeota archaeon]
KGKIIETEAYIGPKDKASHAYLNKKTKRNWIEFEEGGYVYIYLVYGMYYQLNIVTYLKNKPECVLIRAVIPYLFQNNKLILLDKKLTNGPGKICKFFQLDKSFYGEDLSKSKRLYLEDLNEKIKKEEILKGPRINIDYAGEYWKNIPWRFFLKNK